MMNRIPCEHSPATGYTLPVFLELELKYGPLLQGHPAWVSGAGERTQAAGLSPSLLLGTAPKGRLQPAAPPTLWG